MAMSEKYLRPDAKGRISLGKLAENVVQFKIVQEDDGTIVLSPEAAIPVNELWLYKNKSAFKSVATGIEQSLKGQTKKLDLGRFMNYVDEE